METDKNINSLEEYIVSNSLVGDWEFGEYASPKPWSWKEIDAKEFPEDRWIVKNLFPREGISIFASISGEGKSLLLMHLAKCLSEGKPWFGHQDFKTTRTRVLYVNLEMSVSEIQRRGRKIGFDPENEDLIILNEDDFNLNEPLGQDDLKYKWLLNFIYNQKIGVVIIDTFRAVSGGLKEEKAEEIRKFFQKFMVLKNSGISIIFLEHVRKPTQMEGKIPRKEQLLGSQDKTACVEILLMIRRDDVTGNINVYQRKNRLGVEGKPFAVKMTDVIDDRGNEKIEFAYVGEIDDDVNKKEQAKELILQILSSGGNMDRKELGELTKKQVGEKNLRAGLKELLALGEIDYIKIGKRHSYFLPTSKQEPPKTPDLEDMQDAFDIS